MSTAIKSHGGMVVAPHHLAAKAGADILREGGNAIEAMIAAAATIVVAYPHMNGLGGDNFWLLYEPGKEPIGIDACGAAAAKADIAFYKDQGLDAIPGRGPLAALTMGGTVSGWQKAFEISASNWSGKLPLDVLLAQAIVHAREGIPVANSVADNLTAKRSELQDQPGFADCYIPDGHPLKAGDPFVQEKVARTLEQLVNAGLDDFYRGDLGQTLASELEQAGSPLRHEDFLRHQSMQVKPLSLKLGGHTLYNMPPPTQGLASLLLLGIYDKLNAPGTEDFAFVHGLVEATKRAFQVRDSHICDPANMTVAPEEFLNEEWLKTAAAGIDHQMALPWPEAPVGGDTVWLGAVDDEGRAVSFIQSVYWEFGSGVVLPKTGVTWQNRGTSFNLSPVSHNRLEPNKRPFHTIQPALAHLGDGRVMPYGTMGGEGQPQTQAMIFARHILKGMELQAAINAPRWLLGRTWGSTNTNLRIENRFVEAVYDGLREAGHDVEIVGAYEEIMGHAGALVLHPSGLIEGASDPRSDGAAVDVESRGS